MFEDISGLRKAHAEELRLLPDHCQAAIDVVPDILFVKSADGQRCIFSNRAGAEGVSLTAETIIEHNDDLTPPEVPSTSPR